MRILDSLFYLTLCIVIIIAFFLHNPSDDLYFSIHTQNTTHSKEVYEKQSWTTNINDLSSINAVQINDSKYLIAYQSDDINLQNNLYGILFYPHKYTLQTLDGKWKNITINTKTYSEPHILATKEMLFAQTKQHVTAFNTPLLQKNGTDLFLFMNATLQEYTQASKVHVFSAKLSEILMQFQQNDNHKQTNTIPIESPNTNSPMQAFSPYTKLTLSPFINLNAFVAHQPITIQTQEKYDSFILPFFLKFNTYTSLFGIFDSEFHLKEVIKPHNLTYLSKPLITPLQPNYSLDNKNHKRVSEDTRLCIALYHNESQQIEEKNLLYFQTCQIGNGILQFDSLHKSENIRVGDFIDVATLEGYVILLYTEPNNTSLHIGLWDGQDFISLKAIDESSEGAIINPNILTHGEYAYIVYGKKTDNTIHTITLNTTYINNLLHTEN